MRLPRLSVAQLMGMVVLLALIMGSFIAPIIRVAEFFSLQEQMYLSIINLQPTDPNIKPAVWDCARSWTLKAYSNVTNSPDLVSTTEMYRLRDDLGRRLEGDIDLDTLAWLWDRLAETGHFGKEYNDRFRPQFEECF